MEKKSSEQIYLSVIIPAYNEEERLPRALAPTIEFLRAQPYNSEIIIVSDGSADRTKEVAESFLKDFPNLSVIEYFPNRGKGFALKTGMRAAKGRLRFFMDADYAVPVEYVSSSVSMIQRGYDIIIGSRGLKQSCVEVHQPFLRESLAKIFGKIQRVVLRLPFSDTQCGFKLFTKEAADELFPRLVFNCAYFDTELLFIAFRSKMKIGELAVRWRHDGETRLPIRPLRALDLLRKLFMIPYLHRRSRPYLP